MRKQFITVPNGFNGDTVRLDPNKIIRADCSAVLLRCFDDPSLVRWVRRSEYDRLVFGQGDHQ